MKHLRALRRCLSLALLALVAPTAAHADGPVPSIVGPITSPGGAFITPPIGFDLTVAGWIEEEFFVSGTASAYTAATPLGRDGRWTATPGATAPYVTRILVRRPATRRQFNGTVVVEWFNVSGGLDAAPDWTFTHTLLMRAGYAWVGVSAQLVGVSGGSGGPLGLDLSLKAVDPVRYAPLSHPGDSFSYDMFSQVGRLIRSPSDPAPLGPLRPRRVIAIGESQSAARLVTYTNAVQPLARVFDGILIHSRGGGGAALSQSPQPAIPAPTPTLIREDIDVPVLMFQTETDLVSLGSFAARQPDSKRVRTWEVAGTAHGDTYLLNVGSFDAGPGAADTTYDPPISAIFGGIITCAQPINAGPQHYVLSAALARLNRWVRGGRAQGRGAPLLDVVAGSPPVIQRDALGNARGGIRTPQVDVPIATLSGLGQTGSAFCSLFGTTMPLDAGTLAALYPSHEPYVDAVVRGARRGVRDGYLLKVDAQAIQAAAAASDVGR